MSNNIFKLEKASFIYDYWTEKRRKAYQAKPGARPRKNFIQVTDDLLVCQPDNYIFARNLMATPMMLMGIIGVVIIHIEAGLGFEFFNDIYGLAGIVAFILYWAAMLSFYSMIIYFFIIIFIMPKPAPIYFDRKRQIVYSWKTSVKKKRTMAACDFKYLGVCNDFGAVHVTMVGKDLQTPGKYFLHPFAARHSEYNFAGNYINDDFFGDIIAFMEQGKEAIITGESYTHEELFWQKALFYCEKPDNLEAHIEDLLGNQEVYIQRIEELNAPTK